MRLQTRLLLAIGYVLLVAIVAFEVPLAINLSERTDSEIRAQATGQADLLAVAAAEELGENRETLQPLVETSAETVRGRVVIVNGRGRLLADSEGEPTGTDFSNRSEIQGVLEGRRVQTDRESTTLGTEILATATPILVGDEVLGAVRITQDTAAEGRAVRSSIAGLIAIGLIVLAIGLLAGTVVAREISRPIRRLTESARKVFGGDLGARADEEGSREQRDLAAAFNEMTERLSESLAAQRRFVADASHQLRTPLTGVTLRLEEADNAVAEIGAESEQTAAARAELAAARRELVRLAEIVEDLLALGKAQELEADLRRVSAAELGAAAVARWEPEAAERGISLGLERGWAGAVECQPGAAAQALDVLIENAIRYSPAGREVMVTVAPGVIEVVDEGPGIDPAERERIFERFHRGSAGRRGPAGSGLGLSIARLLVRSWGGEVSIANRDPGPGARARITFPCSIDADSGRTSQMPMEVS